MSVARAGFVFCVLTGMLTTVLAGTACAQGTNAEHDAGPRATLILGGPALAVGVVGELIIAVRTPAGYRVLPIAPPRLDSAEIIRSDVDVREQVGGAWLHRTHIRLRPLAPGPLTWPALDIQIEAPDTSTTRMTLASQTFEVASVSRNFENERAPFGLRGLPSEQQDDDAGFAGGVATGVALTLVGAMLLAARQRRRRRRSLGSDEGATTLSRTPLHRTHDGSGDPLDPARARLSSDPREAAKRASAVLRSLVSDRYAVDLRAATTEELRAARPAAAPRRLFEELVRVLERHDSTRFQNRPVITEEVAKNLEASQEIVDQLVDGSG